MIGIQCIFIVEIYEDLDVSELFSDYDSDGSNISEDSLSKLWWNETQTSTTLHRIKDSDIDSDDSLDIRDSDSESATAHVENLQNYDPLADVNREFFEIPEALTALRKQLLGNYILPHESRQGEDKIHVCSLSISERLSLQHYVAWRKSNGTVQGYKLHAAVLHTATATKILPLSKVKKLAETLTGFVSRRVDMCPRSCIAYTGPYEQMDRCPYIHQNAKGQPCNEARYRATSSGRLKAQAQVQILPIMATIRAMFANADTSRLLPPTSAPSSWNCSNKIF